MSNPLDAKIEGMGDGESGVPADGSAPTTTFYLTAKDVENNKRVLNDWLDAADLDEYITNMASEIDENVLFKELKHPIAKRPKAVQKKTHRKIRNYYFKDRKDRIVRTTTTKKGRFKGAMVKTADSRQKGVIIKHPRMSKDKSRFLQANARSTAILSIHQFMCKQLQDSFDQREKKENKGNKDFQFTTVLDRSKILKDSKETYQVIYDSFRRKVGSSFKVQQSRKQPEPNITPDQKKARKIAAFYSKGFSRKTSKKLFEPISMNIVYAGKRLKGGKPVENGAEVDTKFYKGLDTTSRANKSFSEIQDEIKAADNDAEGGAAPKNYMDRFDDECSDDEDGEEDKGGAVSGNYIDHFAEAFA